jgi:hypothetical protein
MRQVLLCAALALLGASGCGQQTTPRDVVGRYLRQVDLVEAGLTKPLNAVTQTGRQFASEQQAIMTLPNNSVDIARQRALLRARSQIKAVAHELAALPAPPAARRLRSLLLTLVARQAGLSHEVALMVTFVPQFGVTLRPLGPATATLERALGVTQPLGYGSTGVAAELGVKSTALRRYASTLGTIIDRLRDLKPPPASMPQYRAQLQTLRHMRETATALASALTSDRSRIPRLLSEFNSASAATGGPRVQRAQVVAIRGYDTRIQEIARLALAVQRERARLAAHLH